MGESIDLKPEGIKSFRYKMMFDLSIKKKSNYKLNLNNALKIKY